MEEWCQIREHKWLGWSGAGVGTCHIIWDCLGRRAALSKGQNRAAELVSIILKEKNHGEKECEGPNVGAWLAC